MPVSVLCLKCPASDELHKVNDSCKRPDPQVSVPVHATKRDRLSARLCCWGKLPASLDLYP